MDNFEVQKTLESLSVIVDTREQPSARAEKRYKAFSAPYRRQKLDYGDYTYNLILPNGQELFSADSNIQPHVMIERKADLTELSMCLCQERARFEREFERAKSNGATIYLFVENANWELLINGKYRTKFNKKAFLASLTAFQARYGIRIIFCKEETTGMLIKEILYREAKERLVNGVYG